MARLEAKFRRTAPTFVRSTVETVQPGKDPKKEPGRMWLKTSGIAPIAIAGADGAPSRNAQVYAVQTAGSSSFLGRTIERIAANVVDKFEGETGEKVVKRVATRVTQITGRVGRRTFDVELDDITMRIGHPSANSPIFKGERFRSARAAVRAGIAAKNAQEGNSSAIAARRKVGVN